jgi:hypothetical protein
MQTDFLESSNRTNSLIMATFLTLIDLTLKAFNKLENRVLIFLIGISLFFTFL